MSRDLTDPVGWARVDRVLTAALDVPTEARAAFLDVACEGDAELRARVERLLAVSEAPSVLDETTQGVVRDALMREATRAWEDAAPEVPLVPRFRIERELGRGGMGTVFLAARDDGAFEQRVAVKVLRRGLDSDDVLARFRRERQILASFDHPHIARLLDGGLTADGRPFLAMEYVDGEPFTTWCDQRQLDVRARLQLFVRICTAVEYAHQRLVVHRDLKPSNMLVDGTGTPKLLDFGIAKLLDDTAGDDSAVTRTGHLYLTPRYASPEQLREAPVTTATDVYQLGLLLYELLTGQHPLGAVEPTVSAMLRAVQEGSIRAPSVVSGRAALRGDLDAIVLEALREDPTARYASVAALREEIERHLAGLPVAARRGATWYRLRRAAWRARKLVPLLVLGVVAVTGYLVSQQRYAAGLAVERNRAREEATIARAERARADAALADAQLRRREADSARTDAALARDEAEAARARAERERDAARAAEARSTIDAARAQQVTTFLTDLFQSPGDTRVARADTISARTLLARGAERVRTELADQPAVLAPLLGAIGTASQRLGITGFSMLFAQERDALVRAFGADDARVTDALRRQGSAHMRERGFADAVAHYAEVAARHARLGAPDSARLSLLLDLANALVFSEQADSAASVLRATERLRTRVPTAASIDAIADAQVRLAAVRRRQGQLDAADSLLRGALALGPGDEIRAQLLNNLGSLLQARGRPEEAEPVYRDATALARRLYPPVERDRNVVANNWAGVLARLQRHEEALAVLREELATHRAHFPPDSWRLGTAEGAMAIQLRTMQRLPEALAHRRRQVAIFTQGLGPAHAWTLGARLDLAELLDATGAVAEASSERDAVEAAAPEVGNEAERTRLLERIRQARATAGPTVGRADSTRHLLGTAVPSRTGSETIAAATAPAGTARLP